MVCQKERFGKYLIEDFKIRNWKNIQNLVSEIIIERSSKNALSLFTLLSGFVIGKKGADIEKIKNLMK